MKRIPISELSRNVLGLPRLTIPSIESTAERYRASVLALRPTGDAVSGHLDRLNAFLAQSAPVLQRILVEKDQAAAAAGAFPFSYIELPMQERLLTSRAPLPVNHNKAFVLKKEAVLGGAAGATGATAATQAGVAAALAHGIATWIADVRKSGVAVPDGAGAPPPADLSPLVTEFGRSLVPSKDTDAVATTPFEALRHIVVLHDGHLYKIDLFDAATGAVHSRALVQKAFEVLLTITPDADNAAPVSVLTAGSRSVWGQAYAELLKAPENAEELRAIRESILVVCLDSKPWAEEDPSRAEAAALHGGREEMENRWFDKHQLIVSADGQVAFNFEPTFSHRSQWAFWISDVLQRATASTATATATAAGGAVDAAAATAILRHMPVTYGKSFASLTRSARQDALSLVSDTEVHSLILPYGRTQFAAMGISADAFVQLTLQVARFTLHERLCATSQTVATTNFFHGSSEILRSATAEARALAEKVHSVQQAAAAAASPSEPSNGGSGDGSNNSSPAAAGSGGGADVAASAPTVSSSSAEELRRLIAAAAHKHDALMREANLGEGVDRHLTALHRIAAVNGDKAALAFFEDDVYRSTATYLLNTCEFSRPWLRYYAMGPACPNGYGLGYVVDETEVRMSVSAFTSNPATDVAGMTASIFAAAETITRCLSGKKL